MLSHRPFAGNSLVRVLPVGGSGRKGPDGLITSRVLHAVRTFATLMPCARRNPSIVASTSGDCLGGTADHADPMTNMATIPLAADAIGLSTSGRGQCGCRCRSNLFSFYDDSLTVRWGFPLIRLARR
jgi:hypothetical protein